MRMNRKGFTLVELMIVLAILGLLAGIGIPSYLNVLNRAKIGTDLARVAQLQTTIDAFIAECGGFSSVTVVDGEFDEGVEALAFTDLTGTSLVTGKTIELVRDYFDDDEDFLDNIVKEMESTQAKALVDETGVVSAV
jgi:prepilin-type N-terminal cleavage/methylation domain-containing protein